MEGKVGKEERGDPKNPAIQEWQKEIKTEKKEEEECKNKIIFSHGYNSLKYSSKTPSSKSLHQLLTASPSHSFLQSAQHHIAV